MGQFQFDEIELWIFLSLKMIYQRENFMLSNSYRKIKQVLWVILFANFVVAILKVTVGTLIKSASMTADGFHSLTDGSSNIVGLIGIRLASKPVDDDHPYGHGKFETLSSMFIAGMLIFVGGKRYY